MLARTATLALAAAALAQPAHAQDSIFEYRFAGIDALAAHPKDAAAHNAFKLLQHRLLELEHELDLEPEAGLAIALAWDMLTGSMALEVRMTEEAPGLALSMSSRPTDGATAASVAERLAGFAQMSGLPMEPDDSGAMLFDSPAGPGSLGVVEMPGGAAASLTVGAADVASLSMESGLLPAGASTIMELRVDLESLSMFVMPMLEQESPELVQMLSDSGWMGQGAPTIEYAIGATDDATLFRARMSDAAELMARSGAGPDVAFNRDHLRAIPGDAVRVYAQPATYSIFSDMADMIEQETGEDIFGQINDELGIDVRGDVIENLGPRQIFYMSDTTGGGGLLSSVLLLELRDPARLARAHAKVVQRLNEEIAHETEGYVKIHASQRQGASAFSLIFPGLPIPLELSWAIAGDHLVVALSPGSLDAALTQLRRGEDSVLDSALFETAILSRLPEQGASSITYADTPRLARRGYGLTNLLMSALANGVRSPQAPDRVASPLLPSFGEFTSDVRPFGMIASWEGEDYIVDAVGDRSSLVNVAAGVASIADVQGIAIAAMGGGVMLPALGQAREAAREVKSMTQVRGIVQGVITYAGNHEDSMPPSLEALVADGTLPAEYLESPFGPAIDGGDDFTFRQSMPGMERFSFDSQRIIAIDRAMLIDRYETSVGFADGHVEKMSFWELEEYLEMPQNQGAREALGIPDL